MSIYKVYKEKPCINCNGAGYHVWNDLTPDCVICKGLGVDMEAVDLEDALNDILVQGRKVAVMKEASKEIKNDQNV